MIAAAILHLVLNRAPPRLADLRWRASRLIRRARGRGILGRRLIRPGQRSLPATCPVLLPRR